MIFISHSNNDEGPYTSLCLALENAGLPFWNPKTMKAGASLKDQLRKAISKCDVCIFIATRSSVLSKWCLAETGAFWGAGKQIILYQANPDIDEMPPLFQGDLWICNIREVINQAREELSGAKSKERHIEELTHTDDIDDIELKLLHRIAHLGFDNAFVQNIADSMGLPPARIDYHLQRLEDLGYAKIGMFDEFGPHYSPTQAGRALLLKKNLL